MIYGHCNDEIESWIAWRVGNVDYTGVCFTDALYIQGVQFDLDSPLTLRLEFARSNTKTTSTKPQQQQQQQQLASSAGCLHHTASAVSVASLTGCE